MGERDINLVYLQAEKKRGKRDEESGMGREEGVCMCVRGSTCVQAHTTHTRECVDVWVSALV